ncbi:MAG: nucleotide exchange factor GrpE [Acetobacteraceae bacterium]|nr:nucleotide exchange factor GrpE [Acetobacteraceae bacterium]
MPEAEAVRAPEAGGPASEAAEAEEVARLRARLDEATALASRYFNSLARVQADFDNYRRRVARERERLEEAALESALLRLLPVVDHLEMAVDAFAQGRGEAAVREGVELTLRQFREVLAGLGVEPEDPVGQQFDPERHEAVGRECSPLPPGTILAGLRKGYSFRGRVLRPALVVVAGPADSGPADGSAADTGAADTGAAGAGPSPEPAAGLGYPGGKDDGQGRGY